MIKTSVQTSIFNYTSPYRLRKLLLPRPMNILIVCYNRCAKTIIKFYFLSYPSQAVDLISILFVKMVSQKKSASFKEKFQNYF